jgi:hypothetical protein
MKDKISSSPYITSYTFMYEVCDHFLIDGYDTNYILTLNNKRKLITNNIKEGDFLFIKTDLLTKFIKNYLPNINCKFNLVTGRSDHSISDIYNELFNNDKLIKMYSVNVTTDHKKLIPIPLGIQNLNWRFDDNPQSNYRLIDDVNKEKICIDGDLLMSFQIHTNSSIRKELYYKFKNKDFTTIRDFGNNDRNNEEFTKDYFREIKRHKFILCPWGNGYDCHRNWEVLYLGSIPIIKNHIVFESFKDLPIWFVDDWDEVNEYTIDKKYNEIKSKKYDTKKIYFDYWLKIINKK